MDGAVGSATNADLAAGAQRIAIVTATPPDAPPDSLFALWNAALATERTALERAGAELLVVQAGAADQEAMGLDMMSGARAPEAFAAGRRSGAEALLSCCRPDRWRAPESACAGAPGTGRSRKYSPPSTLIFGSSLSSQRGSHQQASPNRVMIAGTSMQRTIVASIAIATASPTPNCLTTTLPLSTKLANTQTMISAAEVITRPVVARPSTTALRVSPSSS